MREIIDLASATPGEPISVAGDEGARERVAEAVAAEPVEVRRDRLRSSTRSRSACSASRDAMPRHACVAAPPTKIARRLSAAAAGWLRGLVRHRRGRDEVAASSPTTRWPGRDGGKPARRQRTLTSSRSPAAPRASRVRFRFRRRSDAEAIQLFPQRRRARRRQLNRRRDSRLPPRGEPRIHGRVRCVNHRSNPIRLRFAVASAIGRKASVGRAAVSGIARHSGSRSSFVCALPECQVARRRGRRHCKSTRRARWSRFRGADSCTDGSARRRQRHRHIGDRMTDKSPRGHRGRQQQGRRGQDHHVGESCGRARRAAAASAAHRSRQPGVGVALVRRRSRPGSGRRPRTVCSRSSRCSRPFAPRRSPHLDLITGSVELASADLALADVARPRADAEARPAAGPAALRSRHPRLPAEPVARRRQRHRRGRCADRAGHAPAPCRRGPGQPARVGRQGPRAGSARAAACSASCSRWSIRQLAAASELRERLRAQYRDEVFHTEILASRALEEAPACGANDLPVRAPIARGRRLSPPRRRSARAPSHTSRH